MIADARKKGYEVQVMDKGKYDELVMQRQMLL
jgi:hypothetical protein